MSIIKFWVSGVLWAAMFYVGFNALYWLGLSTTHIAIIG